MVFWYPSLFGFLRRKGTINRHECNHGITKLECLAVVWTVKHLHQVRTGDSSIKKTTIIDKRKRPPSELVSVLQQNKWFWIVWKLEYDRYNHIINNKEQFIIRSYNIRYLCTCLWWSSISAWWILKTCCRRSTEYQENRNYKIN